MNLVNGGHTHKYLTVSLIDDIRHACRAIYDRIAEIDYINETLEEERAKRKKKNKKFLARFAMFTSFSCKKKYLLRRSFEDAEDY